MPVLEPQLPPHSSLLRALGRESGQFYTTRNEFERETMQIKISSILDEVELEVKIHIKILQKYKCMSDRTSCDAASDIRLSS